jgi:aryl carrier-like protein
VMEEEGAEGFSPGGFREQLQGVLPEYMVPGAFVVLESLPLTPNGKLDRRALLAPDISGQLKDAYAAPTTPVQAQLCAIWQEILNVQRVGINDNFFSLGGDSIRSVQIVHSAKRWGLNLSINQLFQNQTVSALARTIEGNRPKRERKEPTFPNMQRVVAIAKQSLPGNVEEVYPMSSMQRMMVDQYNAHADSGLGVYHVQQSFYFIDEHPSSKHFKKALQILVGAHPILRTRFIIVPGLEPAQVVLRHVDVDLHEQDIQHLSVSEQEAFIRTTLLSDRRYPFDTSAMLPLCRFSWFRRSPTTCEFFMAIHHAIDDGWGNVVFLQQLLDFYDSLKNGNNPTQPRSTNVYREFVGLENEVTRSSDAQTYWRRLKFPTTTCPRSVASVRALMPGFGEVLEIASELGHRIRNTCKDLRVSLKSYFLASYLMLIEAQTGRHPATVGLVMNGRSERLSDPFNSLGLFWNILPFTQQKDCRTFPDALVHVHQLLLESEPFSNYGFHKTTEGKSEEIFFATFNFVNFHHAKRLSQSTPIKVLRTIAHDKFHYPLNFAVAMAQHDASASITIEYDHTRFALSEIEQLGKTYNEILTLGAWQRV